MQKSKNILLLILTGFIMMACQDVTRPSDVLSKSDFEDVLYDMHLSHYIDYDRPAGDTLSDAAHRYALTLDVLRKHDISQAEWDSSVVYYTRHAVELKEIYDDMNERMSYLTEGAGIGEGSNDSTDIWKADRHLLLTAQRGSTTLQWSVKADTLLKPGEKLNLRYLCLFLNSQAQNRMMTVLTIRLNNDSIILRNQISTQTGINNITIEDDKRIGIKSISGYFMIMRPSANGFGSLRDLGSKNTVKNQIVFISDIQLTHEPPHSDPPQDTTNANATDTISDSNRPRGLDNSNIPHGGPGMHGPDGVPSTPHRFAKQ